MKLTDYIAEHHNSNTSAFARSQHVSESQARRWLKRNCVVIDGAVYCEVSKQLDKKLTTRGEDDGTNI